MQQKCGNCGKCDVMYTKAYCKFLRSDYGYCYVKKKVVPVSKLCDKWQRRMGRNRSIHRAAVIQAMEKGLTDLAVLRQIFTEDTEKEETHKIDP